MMENKRLIAMVNDILGDDDLCSGCRYGEKKGHEEYDSCAGCRRIAADEIIAILKQHDRQGKWIDGKCSECGCHAPYWAMASAYYKSNFCPNCGARMEMI